MSPIEGGQIVWSGLTPAMSQPETQGSVRLLGWSTESVLSSDADNMRMLYFTFVVFF